MRRPRGHIQQRSEGSFRLRYTLGRDPVTGKRRIATTTVRGTRKDAERELTRLLRTADTGEHVDPSRMTVRHDSVGNFTEVIRAILGDREMLSRSSTRTVCSYESCANTNSKSI